MSTKNMNHISRRNFLTTSAAVIASLTPCRFVLAESAASGISTPTRSRKQALYCFHLLGDLHYDKMTHHDLDWVKAEKPHDIRQIEGYVEVTKTHTPQLFDHLRKTVSVSPVKTAAVIQAGDFTEGLCGSKSLQSLQFKDASALVDQSCLGVPFLVTKGNHDITGPGAKDAFNETLLPWMAKQAGRKIDSANYTWTRDKDLFVFFDAYDIDMDWLERQSSSARDARHVFFVIHPPVVPYNARANWHIFDREKEAGSRARLLAWMGAHKAIVLSGHLHRYSVLDRATSDGLFSQLAVCSVIRHDREDPQKIRTGLDAYSKDLLKLEPDFSPKTIELRKAWLEKERPYIRRFDYARFPGYATLWVYEDRVETDIFVGISDEPWKQQRASIASTSDFSSGLASLLH